MAILQEFKKFMMRGNVIDLAVGVVVGGAFGQIVTSLVNDIVMPPIGWVLDGVNFKDLKYVLKANYNDSGELISEASINYGSFIQTIINFLIIGASIFFVVKAINSFQSKKEEVPAAPPAPTKEETLLTEIRDLLKNK